MIGTDAHVTILIVEDDHAISKHLSQLLRTHGYNVAAAAGQSEAMARIEKGDADLVLLDLSLPDGNGYAVCTYAKQCGDIPVIFLTASDDETSVVTGFHLGADDYVCKPFRSMELLSRIKNVLRRTGKAQSVFEYENLSVDTVRAVVSKNNAEIFLSALEYKLLLVFVNNKGVTLSRGTLLEQIWDIAGEYVNDNTLTVYIKRLREKIEDDPQNPTIIKTVRGLGYRLA